MSASMIRRGLELLNDDRKGRKSKKGQIGAPGKRPRRSKIQQGAVKNMASLKNKRFVSAIDEHKKKQKRQNHLSSNLKYFLGTNSAAQQSSTQKILHQNSGRQSRYQPDRPVAKPQEEKSVFSEEEFQAFQKEYFGKIVEDKN